MPEVFLKNKKVKVIEYGSTQTETLSFELLKSKFMCFIKSLKKAA